MGFSKATHSTDTRVYSCRIRKCAPGASSSWLCVELLHLTSPLLHQFFLTSIFMQTEIHIQEGALFCDSLCDNGLPIWGQKARLAECERMLVALDLALWLNDSGAALQVVVGCYGLLAPLIYHQIPSEDVLQILIKCLMVLQEISGTVKKKRNVETAESLQHMVACMTYYVVKGLRLQKETRMADMMVEQGKKLLMEIADRSPGGEDSRKAAGHHGDEELNETLKSLDSMKLRKSAPLIAHEATWSKGLGSHDLTGHEDPVILYTVIETQAVRSSFRDVMRFKRKPGFMEFVVLVLQKAMQEDQLDMVVQSGQEALHFLGRRDEELLMKKAQIVMISETRKPSVTPGDQFKRKKPINDKKEEMLLKKRLFALKNQKSEKECKVVDNLIQHMTLLVKRQQHRRRLRLVCSEEWVWRCHVNLLTARANFILLHRNVSQQGSTRQLCYSQLPSSLFSLPRCGTLVCWRSGLQHIRTPDPCVPTAAAARTAAQQPAATRGSPRGPSHSNRDRTSGSYGEDLYSDESDPDHEQDAHRRDALSGLKQRIPQQVMLSKAALHLRRAIVLAHRGGHWTSLQTACAVLWNQACTLPMLLVPPPADCLGVEQVYSSLTPVLAVACELLMDMMDRLKLWRVYDEEEQDLGASLHFSSTLDDCTRVDLRWIKTMVLHTLELLYYQAKWETLAHLALTYNFYTRERYTQMVTPLLVYAQRRLQDRIALFGGPPSPQPHHIQTTEITGESINCRNYVGKQVTCVWRTRLRFKRTSKDTSEIPQMKRAMALVSVPLDVEDTLCCFRDSLERGSHTLLAFQHSHTLLMLLLAHTQPCLEVPFSKDAGAHTPGRVEFSGMVYTPPTIAPPDLSNEDFSALSSICACPLPPSQMQTVLSSLNSSAKHLQAGNLSSLRAQTLHDLGNLHYYKGSRRSARSFWAKALDCALQGSGVLEAWDGVSWQGLSPQQVLKQAGLWGCLQGAVLTAKIAQYILTSDVSQRTKCCLLSAYLFKSLLQASLPHPQANLQYSSYTVVGDLIPGLDLFADPQRGGLSATVSSLGFLCHWLYAAGHYVTVLPVLCLYLHLVGRVCKDPHLTVRARILKVRTLTELGMFSQALREVRRLVNADDVPLPHTYNSTGDTARMKTKFQSNKPITEPANLQSVDALLSSRESSDTSALYGPLLCQWLVLARVQLLLALCERIHTLPDPLGTVPQERETTRRSSDQTTRRSSDQTPSDQATRQSSETEDGQKSPLLGLKKPSPGKVKALLLREACTMLDPVLRSGQAPPTGPEDMELVVEAGLLQSALYLQQGKVSDSADQAVCILRLLQDSVVFQAVSHSSLSPGPRSSMLRLRDSRQNADERDSKSPPQLFDVPTAVEARERMGPSLWLRCRLAAVRSLVAHLPDAAILPGVLPDAAILPGVLPDAAILPGVLPDAAILPGVLPDAAILPGVLPDAAILPGVLPDAAILPGVDSGEEAECVLKEGLQEAEQWGCVETHAALLLLGVRLDTHRARPREYSTVLLQEAVSLLSGRGCVSLGGCVTLARATLLLSDLRGSGGQALLLLTQRLLLQQLTQLGESVDLGEGGRVVLPAAPGLSNTHHPQLVLLASTTFRLGHCLLREASVKPAETGGYAGQPPHQRALEVLQSALHLCQALGSRPRQLEADILYCMGLAERSLLSQSDLTAHAVAKTFLRSINICMDHCPNLQHVQRCYLEMAGVYLKQREERTPDPGQSLSAPNTPSPKLQTLRTQLLHPLHHRRLQDSRIQTGYLLRKRSTCSSPGSV
ncbi:cilia- and flagella-associated protein 54 [Clupea harengus]|uniref:Cilia- and flagella-associated protein 54 n=1 Tax=Clupea harengus TaxID=7950 RepID=A0A8M1KTI2_CLUHA|nr:cilia- and flagella-associated protein 54 [Clupea harengus]